MPLTPCSLSLEQQIACVYDNTLLHELLKHNLLWSHFRDKAGGVKNSQTSTRICTQNLFDLTQIWVSLFTTKTSYLFLLGGALT